MVRLLALCMISSALACGDSKCAACGPGDTVDAPSGDAEAADAAPVGHCASGQPSKIKFTQETGCLNDGFVEFCAPANDATVTSALAAISSAITCEPGGGRAMCLASPNLVLCMYPTVVPTECVARHGAMTDAAWSDVCAISALPQITEIVPTIFE